jgi:hypothetical protein
MPPLVLDPAERDAAEVVAVLEQVVDVGGLDRTGNLAAAR